MFLCLTTKNLVEDNLLYSFLRMWPTVYVPIVSYAYLVLYAYLQLVSALPT